MFLRNAKNVPGSGEKMGHAITNKYKISAPNINIS